MASEPEDTVAMIDACRLVAALLRGEQAKVAMRDTNKAGRLITQLARVAGGALLVRAQEAGHGGEAAHQAAAELAAQVLDCESELLTTTGRVYDPAASMVKTASAWPDPVMPG
jgi:hypothetical protein